MKSKALLTAIVLASSASPLFASVDGCMPPAVPTIPKGDSSTEAEMVDGVKAFKDYQALALDYRECLDKLIIKAEAEVSDEANSTSEKAVELFNASVEEEKASGDELNSQIRTFKAKGA